ncbi:succinate dehydrogenase cytochrome b560 subunit-like [Teleopsis dalmanni]|uniref:succinate dehydrogenase cytochrome b560 subunit-like n=1 Tax=Teleopsis dalmanni TaxID=139649 RepID=UPI0018CD179B|nr:succinate dehydrogenase cytochrome b560 subunit-like [Teleopsis dalmanni]XP_037945466.1 succinate dehydrogenase cytochrome b560 subunit-like [Teleopsis dalmanni]
MFAISRSLVRSPALRQGLQMMQPNFARQVTIKIKPATSLKKESYDEKNTRLGREMSPHLTIYKPQLTSMLSITHRGTGFALGIMAWGLGLGALISSHDACHYFTMMEGLHLSGFTLGTVKALIAFPFAYHTCNGVRHLLWDGGLFLKLSEVYTTGYAMLGASTLLTIILAIL